MTFVPIEIKLQVSVYDPEICDANGPVACRPPYPLRVGVLLTKDSSSRRYIDEYAVDLKRHFDAKPTTEVIVGDLNDCGDVVMQQLELADYSGGAIHFTFKLRQAGEYQISASVNEIPVKRYTHIVVDDNPDGEPVVDDLEAEYEKAMLEARREEEREEREKERQFMENKRRQQEEDAKRYEEELRLKTKERAEQSLKQHMMDKKVREMRDLQLKKERQDMRVGGGFDLEKYNTMKKTERQKDSTRDPVKALIAEKNRKETLRSKETELASPLTAGYSEVPEPYTKKLDRQMSQYEGINLSEYNDNDIDQSELQSQYANLQAGQRPGSGYKIRPIVIKGSRPSSRVGDDKNKSQTPFDPRFSIPGGGSMMESQFMSRIETSDSMRKQPVKVTAKTGDNFFQGQDGFNPELLESRDLRDSRGLGHVKEKLNHAINFERQSTGQSQTKDRVNSSQSNRTGFKIGSSSTNPMRRGLSTDKNKADQGIADDKTAPKKTKGGLSQQRKPDLNRMPLIGTTGTKPVLSQAMKLKRR